MASHLSRSIIMHRELHRLSLSTFDGPIFTWDVDNTYLITPLESIWAMMGVAFELAVDKRPVPGATWLLKELRRASVSSAGARGERCPIFFISASPAQFRAVFERRMLLDGVEYDGITLRNWLGLLGSGRIRPVRTAFAYKLAALLENRLLFPANEREFLFGDDLEQDAAVYTLYGRILTGDATSQEVAHRVRPFVTWQEDVDYISDLIDKLRASETIGGVEAAFIRCVRRPDRAEAAPDPDQPVPVYYTADMLDTATLLAQRGVVGVDGLHRIALGMLQDGWSESALEQRLRAIRDHKRVDDRYWRELTDALGQSLGRRVS